MIEKQRLEDLIKQGATIYEAKYNDVVPVSLTNEINCISWRYGVIAFKPMRKHKWLNHKYFKNLFETEDEAREHLEFGNITRTERLELPNWEEFKTTETITKFFNKDINYSLYVYVKNKNTNNCKIMIYADNGEQEWWEFQKPLTRENYNEARRLCVKLFKGENV